MGYEATNDAIEPSSVLYGIKIPSYLDMRSCRWAVAQCLSHSGIESKVLLSARQRYLPSAVLFGPKLALLVRLYGFDKNSPPAMQENLRNAHKVLWLQREPANAANKPTKPMQRRQNGKTP